MVFNVSFIFLICSMNIIPVTYSHFTNMDEYDTFDNDLYESVLDPEQCQKQLDYIKSANGTALRLQFIESGLRIPRGILKGNLVDLGNYPQCLSISQNVEDMIISGKYCTINAPTSVANAMEFDVENFEFDDDMINEIEKFHNRRALLLPTSEIGIENIAVSFTMAICVPRPCTTKEALNGLYFEMNAIHSKYTDVFCRLPDDKPKVAVDYIAWVIIFLLGLCTLLSTSYDVRHRVVLKRDPKKASELLSAFSAYKNIQNLVKINSKSVNLECLDGIRALSIFWVIIGHTFIMGTYLPSNILDIQEWASRWTSIWITTGLFAVDTFFLLSGLLLVYTTAKKVTTMQLLKNLHIFYLHRILRMFPVLAAVILFKTSFYHHIADGPMWQKIGANVHNCRSYWWVTLLYIQNFVESKKICIGEAWYLGIDLQLHILSPLVLFWILSGKNRFAWFGLTTAFLVSCAAGTIYIFINNLQNYFDGNFKKYYVNILTRAPPFFVGMIYGYLLHLYRSDKFVMKKIFGYVSTIFALGLIALIFCLDYLFQNNKVDNHIFNKLCLSFLRTFWVIAVGWLIFACVNGYIGPINWFLSLPIWKIPARISYAMYLIHMSIMFIYYGSMIQPMRFSVGGCMFDFFAFLYITLFISFFVTALIDAPFATLFRLLLEKGNIRAQNENKITRAMKNNGSNAP